MKKGNGSENYEELFSDLEELMDIASDEDFEAQDVPRSNLDARRRLEEIFEAKRLQSELDDYVDY